MKPIDLCRHNGCGERAVFEPFLMLRNVVLNDGQIIDLVWKASANVCEHHRQAAREYILNDENRDRLVHLLRDEGLCNSDLARKAVKRAVVEMGLTEYGSKIFGVREPLWINPS